jgi:hypothetical protein
VTSSTRLEDPYDRAGCCIFRIFRLEAVSSSQEVFLMYQCYCRDAYYTQSDSAARPLEACNGQDCDMISFACDLLDVVW